MSVTNAVPSTIVAQFGLSRRLRLWPEWLALFLYASIVAYAIPFHEPWADEAQAWQIARALPARDIFLHAGRYEGSPTLWHLFLRGLVDLHVSYIQMHWIAGLIGACGVSLLTFFAPFPRWVRLALPFTVFLIFQWTVVARSYVFVPLLAFAAAITWRKNALALALLLGLLANTSLHGFALAVGLCIVYLVEARRGLHAPKHLGAFVLAVLTLFSVAIFVAMPPPPDLSFSPETVKEPLILHFFAAAPVGAVYLLRAACYSTYLLGSAIAILTIWTIHRVAGTIYLVPLFSVAFLSGFGYFNYWHLGFATIAVITTSWIAWQPCTLPYRLVAKAICIVCIALQLTYSMFALIWDHRLPYSPDAAASQYLKRFVEERRLLAVTVANTGDPGEFHSIGLGPYFDKPIFLNQPHLYWFWTNKEHSYSQFKAALDQNPTAIVAMYRSHNGRPFDRSHDLNSRRLEALYQRGYGVTAVFCGEMPAAMTLHEQTCEIILER